MEKKASYDVKVQRLLQKIVRVKYVMPTLPSSAFNVDVIVQMGQSIKENGCVAPMILERTGDEAYKVVQGNLIYHACNTSSIKQINAFVADNPNQSAVFLKQFKLNVIGNIG